MKEKIGKIVFNIFGVASLGMFMFGFVVMTQINANMDFKFLLGVIFFWSLSVIYLFWGLNRE